mmetsp:Transcript_41271/g.105107  ORF Transcript_41271/g.105107 Transcript_41271/m.105107 type:complete len:286 (-) Transcript_41271:279-1136(-)
MRCRPAVALMPTMSLPSHAAIQIHTGRQHRPGTPPLRPSRGRRRGRRCRLRGRRSTSAVRRRRRGAPALHSPPSSSQQRRQCRQQRPSRRHRRAAGCGCGAATRKSYPAPKWGRRASGSLSGPRWKPFAAARAAAAAATAAAPPSSAAAAAAAPAGRRWLLGPSGRGRTSASGAVCRGPRALGPAAAAATATARRRSGCHCPRRRRWRKGGPRASLLGIDLRTPPKHRAGPPASMRKARGASAASASRRAAAAAVPRQGGAWEEASASAHHLTASLTSRPAPQHL